MERNMGQMTEVFNRPLSIQNAARNNRSNNAIFSLITKN